ncbi:hypothetical protein BofuT4_P015460.1 [Botrytis cinerea T4]|uniref:Uncharacterized protein n=1 Tax=Botryotinia fuckeliana (strain T4) TaxID=999810 RepID=G2YHQ3_BOTF4|nr:hypothetical protein BofuT4_P015460.1 [Botrytis cinerea T4]
MNTICFKPWCISHRLNVSISNENPITGLHFPDALILKLAKHRDMRDFKGWMSVSRVRYQKKDASVK